MVVTSDAFRADGLADRLEDFPLSLRDLVARLRTRVVVRVVHGRVDVEVAVEDGARVQVVARGTALEQIDGQSIFEGYV